MTPFDRFAALNLDPTHEHVKVSSAGSQLPDSEFALVVKSSTGSVRHLPMHNRLSFGDSVAVLLESQDILPSLCVKTSAARMLKRMDAYGIAGGEIREELADLGAGAPGDVLYWSEVAPEWTKLEVQKASSVLATTRMDLPVVSSWQIDAVEGPFEVRKISDIRPIERWTSENLTKLSEADRRKMACGLRAAYEGLGADFSSPHVVAKVSTFVERYAGGRVREDAKRMIVARLRALEKTSTFVEEDVLQSFSRAYMAIADSIGEHTTRADAEEFVGMLSELDKTSGISPPVPAVGTLFYAILEEPARDLTKVSARKDDESEVDTFHQTKIRKKHLKALSVVNLEILEKTLGEEAVNALREDPVDVYKSLPAPQRRIVAQFVEKFIILSQKNLDGAV